MSSPERSTRRRFLRRASIVVGGSVIAAAGAWRYARGAAADLYRRIVELPPGGDVAPIDPSELRALIAATKVLLVEGIDERRYEEFFRWKSENAPGYKALYARFRAAVDSGGVFADAPLEQKRAILAKAKRVRDVINSDDKLGALSIAVFDRDWLQFERYIVREVLTLFARTDAWLLSGYGPHPGVPRGLEAYRAAPNEGAQ
jgi:hypothetical protein